MRWTRHKETPIDKPASEPTCDEEHEDCKMTSKPALWKKCDKPPGHRGKHRCRACKKEYSQGRGQHYPQAS
jgi:hypothetical protein